QIKDTGKLIFSKEELKVLGRAGTAKNRILAIEKKLKQRIKKINSTFNAKLADRVEPHKLVDVVSKSPQKTAQLKRMLSPEEWVEYQGARRAKLVQNMTNNKGELTLNGIASALKEPDLRLSLGPKYVKDLQVAERYLKILAKKQKGIGEAKARAAVSEVDVARAMIFGPLSHTGFIITRLKGLFGDWDAKAMARLLNDPELLSRRIEIFKSPKRKQLEQLQDLWGVVGLPLVLNQSGLDEQKSLKSFDKERR
ncbi:MAG: hypothetical protein ACUZ8H_06775, partial [Candidatus Anammoxibacter sp.]